MIGWDFGCSEERWYHVLKDEILHCVQNDKMELGPVYSVGFYCRIGSNDYLDLGASDRLALV